MQEMRSAPVVVGSTRRDEYIEIIECRREQDGSLTEIVVPTQEIALTRIANLVKAK